MFTCQSASLQSAFVALTALYRIAFGVDRKSYPVLYEQQRTGTRASRSSVSIVPKWLAGRV